MQTARGFSLIEMAFVLVIITLLLGGLLVPFATQVEQRRIAETNKGMEEIKEALLGYALVNGRLPCPDTLLSNDGLEDPQGGPCPVNTIGNLPWATLGVGASDAWGNRFSYQVSPEFADPVTRFSLATMGTLKICTTNACASTSTLANKVPAVIVSHGKNGLGAINANIIGPTVSTTTPIGMDEQKNIHFITPSNDFVSRIHTSSRPSCTDGTATPCEFDDLVTWLSPNILFNRVVAAGKLP